MAEQTTTPRLAQIDQATTPEAKVQICAERVSESDKELAKGTKERWKKNLALYEPEKNPENPSGVPYLKANMSYSNIETIVSEMVDKWPVINIVPGDSASIQHSDIMQQRHDDFITEAKHFTMGVKAIRQGLIIDHCIMQENFQRGPGGIVTGKYSIVDPMTFKPSPNWSGLDVMENEAQFIDFSTADHIDNILELYADEIGNRSLSPSDNAKYNLQDLPMSETVIRNEIYFRSTTYQGKKVAPYLRKIFFIENPAIILLDRPQQFNRMPYFLFAPGAMANRGRGTALTNLIKTIQETAGVIYSKVALAVSRQPTGTPWAKQALLDRQPTFLADVTAGNTIEVDSEGDFGHKPAPEVAQSCIVFLQELHSLNRFVTRIQEVMQGKEQYAGMPMGAILALQQASKAVVRLLSEESVVPMFEEQGRYNLAILQAEDTGKYEIMRTEGLGMKATAYDPKEIKGKKFKVSVVAGGGMPRDPAVREARAKQNLADGTYSRKRAIMNMVDNNKQELINEMEQGDENTRYGQLLEAESQAEQKLISLTMNILTMLHIGNDPAGLPTTMDPALLDGPTKQKYLLLEDQAAEILDSFPNLLKSAAFQNMPKSVQQILANIFVKPADEPGPAAQPLPPEEVA